MTADPLLDARSQFPILATTNYLISNSLGAVPAAAGDALREYYETWATRGVRAWEEAWWELAASLGDQVAPLIGAGPDEVVFQPNVTVAHSVIFSALDFSPGSPRRRVVTDAMHFPTILYLLEGLAAAGAEVVVVPSVDGVAVDSSRVAEAIDDRTALVALSHVLFKSSYIHDFEPISARARDRGALLVVDGYQAVGSIPVDVAAIGADVYIGGCLKWLCGGPGAAFLWARPDLRPSLAPRQTGWMAHRRPFAFEPTLDRRDDAWRFLTGTPNVPALYAARPGLEIISALGIEAIRAKSLRQTARLIDLADARGLLVNAPRDPARRGGTVAIDVPEGRAVSAALKSRQILCDYRPGAGIRFSPHFYNHDDEPDAAIAEVVSILETGAWRAFADRPAIIT